jgi:tRNA A-37 threonylcarbamoyl transferase component Bud32
MGDDRILDALGPQFRVERRPRAWWAARRDVEAVLASAGFGPESDGELRTSDLVGRKPLAEIAVGASRFVVRRFTHGGLWRFATGRRFLDPTRPFQEIVSARHLEDHGVRTVEIVAARARRSGAFGFELDLVTKRVEGVIDLGELLGRARRGAVPRAVIAATAAALGILVKRMHACGFFHADLTPNNVLVNESVLAGADPELVVLDLDRARIQRTWTDRDRRTNLRRLLRFVARREARDGRALARADYARFFKGYDPSGENWRADWRAIESAHARSRFGHEIGWRLEKWFGKGRDVREVQSSARSTSDSSRATRG